MRGSLLRACFLVRVAIGAVTCIHVRALGVALRGTVLAVRAVVVHRDVMVARVRESRVVRATERIFGVGPANPAIMHLRKRQNRRHRHRDMLGREDRSCFQNGRGSGTDFRLAHETRHHQIDELRRVVVRIGQTWQMLRADNDLERIEWIQLGERDIALTREIQSLNTFK